MRSFMNCWRCSASWRAALGLLGHRAGTGCGLGEGGADAGRADKFRAVAARLGDTETVMVNSFLA